MQLVKELKYNNEDYEFYPTTDEMLAVIAPYMQNEVVLDIGCGNGKFKTYMDMASEELAKVKTEQAKIEAEKNNYQYAKTYLSTDSECQKINKYFVIEKSLTLIQRLPEAAVCLGTDFNDVNLIDKKVDTIFCNPPYSEFKNWMSRIIEQGFFTKQAFLIVPTRWEKDESIQALIKGQKLQVDILGTFDFLNAERSARANVHVLRLVRRNDYFYKYNEIKEDAFDKFFQDTFGRKVENKYDHRVKEEYDERIKNKLQNALVTTESKAKTIVELYSEELNILHNNLKAIMQLDDDILATFNINTQKIKQALIEKMNGLKIIYWNLVWDELEEITDRLTYNTRTLLKQKHEKLYCMDITIENIYVMILYVLKHANSYYDYQLIDFYKELSNEQNVKPYKSNQKLFENSGWRWNCNEHRDYYLDYRIIMSSPFRTNWSGKLDTDSSNVNITLNDIKVIARNLGFKVKSENYLPSDFNKKGYLYNEEDKVFMEFKVYKNGNMHVRFNQEFTKALNIEAARLLGWIKTAQDVVNEFPEEYAEVAEKYFKTNYSCTASSIGLLPVLEK